MHDHTSSHLFECKSLPTSLSSLDLWTNPDKVEPFLATWGERLLAATLFRVLDSAGSTLVEWGRQQQQLADFFKFMSSIDKVSCIFTYIYPDEGNLLPKYSDCKHLATLSYIYILCCDASFTNYIYIYVYAMNYDTDV